MTPVQVIRGARFTADRPWGAIDVANFSGITARVHWTDQAYPWHLNDGDELFVVLDGIVDMHYRQDGQDRVVALGAGDLFFISEGAGHRAHPRGEARVLVVEREGSI